jgi:hypothetical protein
MTIPNDNTPASIIQDAYFDAGLIQEGETANSEKIANGMRKLRDLINLWQTQGLKLWLNQDTAVTLTAGTGTYTFGPTGSVVMVKPERVIDAYYLDINNVSRPLIPISRSEWDRLGNKTNQGAINSYFVDKQQTYLGVKFYNVPDATTATGTVHLIFQMQVTNFSTLTETMNFPVEWRIALRWGLADELATGQPQSIMDRCAQRALAYRTALEDVEDTDTRLAPDSRAHRFSGTFS